MVSRKNVVFLLAAVAGVSANAFLIHAQLHAQVASYPKITTPSASPVIHTLVVLDPAHGGSDSGAVVGDHANEKEVTLAIASRLRSALVANGFTVAATRDADIGDPLSPDQRAELANRNHPVACIVLHATATGSGVHIYTSTLQPSAPAPEPVTSSTYVPIPWNTAQTGYVGQSQSLAGEMGMALGKQHLPALVGASPIRPLDNLMCPAVAIELAPLLTSSGSATPATDADYQQQVVNVLAGALRAWRETSLASAAAAALDRQTLAQAKASAASEAAGHAAPRVHSGTSTTGSPSVSKGPQ